MAIDLLNSYASISGMRLDQYLEKHEISQTDFAASLGVSPGLVYQWLSKRRPVSSSKCVLIEQRTFGEVTRRELREDWRAIWPELDETADSVAASDDVQPPVGGINKNTKLARASVREGA